MRKSFRSMITMFGLLAMLLAGVLLPHVAYAQKEPGKQREWDAISVDGVKYSQKEFLEKFDNEESILHFYVDKQTETENVFYAFTSQAGLEQFLAKSRNIKVDLDPKNLKELKELEEPKQEENSLKGICSPIQSWAKFYEHIYCDGEVRWLSVGHRVSLGNNWWNDRISSFTTPSAFGITCVWLHSNYQGSRLCGWNGPNGSIAYDLRNYGLGWFHNWNDEISSMAAFGL